LPESVAKDRERLARFQREAEVLASLNHPNIAAIYGLERSNGVTALVMELVEGPTLADRIAQGPIPIDEALPIAKQIAEALEAAHEQGVIHRDLKPANIKLRPDGTVKVLDFGLAKALEPASAAGVDATASPTITSPAMMTGVGMLLGTAAYMSPEQARGKAVDRRSDIWAFGCVLFETLTGKPAFDGEDVAETLGAVIHKEPAWSSLPADTPEWLRTLLRRCLLKDPKKRLPHIGLARIEIEDAPADTSAQPAGATAVSSRLVRSNALAWSMAAAAGVLGAAFGVTTFVGRETIDAQVTRTSLLTPDEMSLAGTPANRFALSPDGRRLAFLASGRGQRAQIWVRSLDSLTPRSLSGTDGTIAAAWSPDGRFLAFVADGMLKKIDAGGGPPVTLANKASDLGLAWGPDGTILFVPEVRSPLFQVSAAGGAPSPVTTLDPASGDLDHRMPFFLPDGRHFLFLAVGSPANPGEARAIYGASLDSPGESRLVLQGGSNAQYSAGYLLFMRETTLMAQPFDAAGLRLTGEAVPLAERLQLGGSTGRNAAFDVSQGGSLVYQTGVGGELSQLVWYDRAGKQSGTLGASGDQMSVELSPDGTRALVSVLDPAIGTRDLWMYDVRRGFRTRFTFDPASENLGTWSPDGTRVVFNSSRQGGVFDLYQKASNGAGAEELLVSDDRNKEPYSWSQDGRVLAYSRFGAKTLQDLWTVTLAGDRKPAVLLETPFVDHRPRVSPDGRWLVYTSNESGRPEVYVTTFPDGSGKWQVSTAGGNFPRWRRDGREIFYLSPDDVLMAGEVHTDGGVFQVGVVQRLFQARPRFTGVTQQSGYGYDVSADGQRFLVNTLLDETSTDPLTLLINWPALLRR
jgi:Tol biopolymer transport system component